MFGVILPSRPVLGPASLQTISATQFAYSFPAAPAFSHLVVFLLPEHTLPPDVLAGIYIQFPGGGEFKLLGGLSADKQSAIFRVNHPRSAAAAASSTNGQLVGGEIGAVAEVDMDADDSAPPGQTGATAAEPTAEGGNVTVGISVEPAATLQPQLAALMGSTGAAGGAAAATKTSPPQTKVLAQRIIRHAFNFLSSFTGPDGKVPLKSFEDWWKKFESRIEADPTFLERQEDG